MNETYNTGSFDYTILKVYSTISKSFATELVDEEYIQPVMNQLNLYRGIMMKTAIYFMRDIDFSG